jgi:hypothetical protein
MGLMVLVPAVGASALGSPTTETGVPQMFGLQGVTIRLG